MLSTGEEGGTSGCKQEPCRSETAVHGVIFRGSFREIAGRLWACWWPGAAVTNPPCLEEGQRLKAAHWGLGELNGTSSHHV